MCVLIIKESVHVAKLMCSACSPFFKKRMLEENETTLELDAQYTVAQMKDLLRWMYVHEFQSKGPDLCSVMSLAHQYQVDRAVRQCAAELSEDMTIEHAAAYLAQEAAMREKDQAVFSGFEKLWKDASEFIQKEFQELNMATLTSEKFLQLTVEGIKVILRSETIRIGTENSVFSAFRLWMHRDFENRKQHAVALLPLIRFTQIKPDFLLDVVKKEGEMHYPEEAKKIFARKIIEAYVYHSTSQERREALRLVTEVPRPYDERLLKETFYWKAENFSELKELWSQPFFLGGYFLHLLLQRKNISGPGGGTLGLYLHIKQNAGLSTEFYVPLAFELLVKNQLTGKFISPKGAYASPFTATNKAWGYVDILNTTWDDFFKENTFNANGCLEVKANVWFKDYWEQLKRK
eukprot:TRINITY_DN3988_c0_g1_i2.p1 TRINITY_DN3988_c0_g1~~TRINITY_DN3988_c0_g1_i2.p1  ORF type:complete len:406 (-),score=79.58 TRINITY_DN3988_c0_g1_i2:134-1351(-)